MMTVRGVLYLIVPLIMLLYGIPRGLFAENVTSKETAEVLGATSIDTTNQDIAKDQPKVNLPAAPNSVLRPKSDATNDLAITETSRQSQGSVNTTENFDGGTVETDHYIQDEYLFDLLSIFLGVKYITCREKSRLTLSSLASGVLKCSCDVETCGIAGNCCPDVNQTYIKAPTSGSPKCQYLFNSLYTEETFTAIKNARKGNVVFAEPFNGLSQTSQNKGRAHTMIANLESDMLNENKNNTLTQNLTAYHTERVNKDSETAYTTDTDRNVDKEISSIRTQLQRLERYYKKYLTIDTCSETFANAKIIEQCVHVNISDIESFIPVSTTNGKTYKNVYCALCNWEKFSHRWDIHTNCLDLYMLQYIPRDVSNLLALVRNCTVDFVSTVFLSEDINWCRSTELPSGNKLIATCNETGVWDNYESMIENMCLAYVHMPRFDAILKGNGTSFKNIFCYMCNTNINEDHRADPVMENLESEHFRHESLWLEVKLKDVALVTQDTLDVEGTPQCPEGSIRGVYEDGCIEFQCPIDQLPLNNFCVPKNRQVFGLSVGVVIHLMSVNSVISSAMASSPTTMNLVVNNINSEIKRVLHLNGDICQPVFVQFLAETSDGSLADGIFVKYEIKSTERCSVEHIISIFTILATQNLTIAASRIHSLKHNKHVLFLRLSDENEINRTFSFDKTLLDMRGKYSVMLDTEFYCPKVVLNSSIYKNLVKQGHIVPEHISSHHLFVNAGKKIVQVCYADYLAEWFLEKYDTRSEPEELNNSLLAKLTFVSTVISILSTIAVLVTYALFSELRFIPGKLFMVLCLNLLLAQMFFACGIGAVEVDLLCTITGFFIHIFWLATIFSMNACLWLMFKTSQQPLGANNRVLMQSRSSCTLCRYVIGCYAVPFVFACLNIYIARARYNDVHYGYGGVVCFISITTLKVITFIGPIVLVLLVNFFMFAIIMASISSAMQSNFKFNSHKQVTVFFKLATMTGIFWFFGLLHEITGYTLFEYLFTILNGGHGFFLMWSFLFNRRVFSLYKTLYRNYFRRSSNSSISLSLSNGSKGTEKVSTCKCEIIEKVATSDV